MSRNTNLNIAEDNNLEISKIPKIITAAYNITGVVLSIAALIYDGINSTVLLLAYPLLGISIVLLTKKNVNLISDGKSRLYSSINLGFMMPILFLAFKSSDDQFLYRTDHFFLPFFSISVVVLILLYFTGVNPILAKNRIDAIFVIALAFVYSYGSTRQINFVFDNSKPKIFKAVILDKTEHHGRHISYYLIISTWGPMQQSERVENNNGLYDRVKIGDTVKVNFKQGVLRMPWYYLSQ